MSLFLFILSPSFLLYKNHHKSIDTTATSPPSLHYTPNTITTSNPQKPTIHHQHSTFNAKKNKIKIKTNKQQPTVSTTVSQTQTHGKQTHGEQTVSTSTANPRRANGEHTHSKPKPPNSQDLIYSPSDSLPKNRANGKWERRKEYSQKRRKKSEREEERIVRDREWGWENKKRKESLREWKATKERENNIILLLYTCYSKF